MRIFELEALGGPWGRRLQKRCAAFDDLPWSQAVEGSSEADRAAARSVWTQSAFFEYASAASFAEIASLLLACGAPIDLIAAAGEFVTEEIVHTQLSARVAMAAGGAVPLEVDLQRLVRPPGGEVPVVRAAEVIVRTCCVGEALTLPLLKATKRRSSSPVVQVVVDAIARDESAHAQLGAWFLDWAAERLTDHDRRVLGGIAGEAVRSFAPLFRSSCAPGALLGVLDCESYDRTFVRALKTRVVAPLAARGIVIDPADLAVIPGMGTSTA